MTETPCWHVYLLRCADGSHYCGIARDVPKRVRQHNGELAGGARYTSGRRPVELLISVPLPTRGEALKLEAAVKKLPAAVKAGFLRKCQTFS